MKETPYAFPSAIADAMIRALLDGRKTQIRIPINPQPHYIKGSVAPQALRGERKIHPKPYFDSYCGCPKTEKNPRGMSVYWCWWDEYNRQGNDWIKSPLGAPGDRVWFREAWGILAEPIVSLNGDIIPGRSVRYRADYVRNIQVPKPHKWRSSRTMPRHLSRITREIVSVRVERVQEITPSDACSEGAAEILNRPYGDPLREEAYARGKWIPEDEDSENGDVYAGSVDAFAALWNRAHGPGAFEKNPLVWVYEVK